MRKYPHNVKYLNTWTPVGVTVWGRCKWLIITEGNMVLSQEMRLKSLQLSSLQKLLNSFTYV